MKKILVILGAVFALTACTKETTEAVKCTTQDTIAIAGSQGIATALSCKNVDAVKASLNTALTSVGLCDKEKETVASAAAGSIGSILCKATAVGTVDKIFAEKVPTEWECSGGVTKEAVVNAINTACDKL